MSSIGLEFSIELNSVMDDRYCVLGEVVFQLAEREVKCDIERTDPRNFNMPRPKLISIYLFVSDVAATSRFYEALGLDVKQLSDQFGRASWSGEVVLEFGTSELTKSYDPDWNPSVGDSKSTINFELESREAVDLIYLQLVAAGYAGHLPPCDPLWQARFAIIEDPDGNFVGLHSKRDN